ncbi:ABC transporter ATP-binding protein [Mycoplasma todarodis]|uniref:ABC transporter ATP-binding protein n=1 Tax=Mycoplasma todarodis TaxID=1937191 RepID=UPI003B3345DE
MQKIILKNIIMRFGELIANDNIDIEFKPGEIHTLLGENGAGKSTLISILQGILTPTSGEIFINDNKVKLNPKKAKKNGIYVVPQHFNIIENTTVIDNVIASSLDKTKYIIDRKIVEKELKDILKKYQIEISLKAKISDLTLGQKQLVEIIRMLYRGSEVIILDEPTAILNKKEITNLIKLLKQMKKEMKTIIFVSHKLEEVLELSDVISVLRKGKLTKTFYGKNNTKDMLVKAMVGQRKITNIKKTTSNIGKKILDVKNISIKGKNQQRTIDDISLKIHEGEIVGIASIDGNGEHELIEAIVGEKEVAKGQISFLDSDITKLPIKNRHEMGMGYVPAETLKHSIAKNLPIFQNLVLNTVNKKEYFLLNFIFNYRKAKKKAREIIEDFDIRGVQSVNKLAIQLSGGNLQKIVVGREITANPKLLVFAEPTKGLDINAINNIYNRIIEYKDQNKGVLLYSSEIKELVDVCDKVYVISEGEVRGIVEKNITEKRIMELLI